MPAIAWPTSSSPGLNPQESGGRLINCLARKAPAGASGPVIWHRSPGLRQLIEVEAEHCRGFMLEGDTLIGIFDGEAYAFEEGVGVPLVGSVLGDVNGTDIVTIAKNNAEPADMMLVSSGTAYRLFADAPPSTSPADVDTDIGAPNSVSSLDGYFLFTYVNGFIRASELNSPSMSTNSFTRAQSRPGGLLRGVAYRKEFFAFGPTFIEVYRDIGTSPFPLEFVTMIPRGIAGTHAVAGWEPGWSNELCWVGDDNVVYKLDGYNPTPISTEAVARDIGRLSQDDKSLLHCFVAMAADHAFLIITSRGNWTWVRDMATGEWHERASKDRADFRGSCSVKAFGLWIMGDDDSGLLGAFEEQIYREYNEPLIMTMESGVPQNFPSRINVPRADFNFTAGTGFATGSIPPETTPRVMISYSKDGGASWGNELHRELGQQGQYRNHPFITRIGVATAHGLRFRQRISDPVHVGFMGATMPLIALAE